MLLKGKNDEKWRLQKCIIVDVVILVSISSTFYVRMSCKYFGVKNIKAET